MNPCDREEYIAKKYSIIIRRLRGWKPKAVITEDELREQLTLSRKEIDRDHDQLLSTEEFKAKYTNCWYVYKAETDRWHFEPFLQSINMCVECI